MPPTPTGKTNFLPLLIVILATSALAGVVYYLDATFPEFLPMDIAHLIKPSPTTSPEDFSEPPAAVAAYFKKFESEAEFKKYLADAEFLNNSMGARDGFSGQMVPDMSVATGAESQPARSPLAERVSGTNVQVLGIDEPDIVKTNGKEIFYAGEPVYYYEGRGPRIQTDTESLIIDPGLLPEKPPASPPNEFLPPLEEKPKTKIFTAFPPESLSLTQTIKKSGNLLLEKNILVVFENENVYGFDISDPKNPQEKWNIDLNENYVVSSRLYNGKLYFVLNSYVDRDRPCPIRPLIVNGAEREIRCADIYHPVSQTAADSVYNIFKVDPATGSVEKTVSFVGFSGSTIIYMSPENLYVAYNYYLNIFGIISDFLTKEAASLFSDDFVLKIKNLANYDIGFESKITEFYTLLYNYERGLSEDEKLKLENEIQNRAEKYFKKRARETELTGIAKIGLENLNVVASGNIPGQLLNQFSLDEYGGYLRAAVTIDGRGGGFSWGWNFVSTESANDVYVLDKNLVVAGAIKDLGLTERIYSARFLGDRGYIVTFRQIDPFYVLDLSDPKNPRMKGELKIPGYSSYLHPLEGDKVLGVGQEGSNVKISIFDASNASEPKEISKYILKEYWTEVSNNHHAFLMDKKHKVFFVPGGQGGYIFSYENDILALKKAVSGFSAKRALYLDDYMYILSADKITVLNENTWERVKELKF